MPYLLVKQKVEDFEKWYNVFKSHEDAQKEAGLKDLQLLRDISDANTIVCIFKVDDIKKAKSFTDTPEASDAQNEAGMIGKPEILLLDEI